MNALNGIGSGMSLCVSLLHNTTNYLWYGSATYLNMRDYQRRLDRLDIPDRLKFVEMLGLEVEVEVESLVVLCNKIRNAYTNISNDIEYQNSKWLSSYRNINIEDNIKDLEVLMEILSGKLQLFMVLSKHIPRTSRLVLPPPSVIFPDSKANLIYDVQVPLETSLGA